MIAALIIGRGGSTGFPRKNVTPVLGRPLMAYPILAALNAKSIGPGNVYLSTDSQEMQVVGTQHGCKLIERPAYLATDEALAEDAFIHGFETIRDTSSEPIEFLVCLFCNGATIEPGLIDRGVETLRADPSLDSAVSVSRYNMWSPLRAKKIENGLLKPLIPIDFWSDASCDRGSQGDVYFADCSAFVCRPICFEPGYGDIPFRWMGRNVAPLVQWGGLDVDFEWQLGQVERWLRAHDFSDTRTPYETSAGSVFPATGTAG